MLIYEKMQNALPNHLNLVRRMNENQVQSIDKIT